MLRISVAKADGSATGGADLKAAVYYYADTSRKALDYYQRGMTDGDHDGLHQHGGECAERPTTVSGGARALKALGLAAGEQVDTDQVAALALGFTPDASARLVSSGPRTAWHDFTFSTPKSYGVLFASLRAQGREREAQLLLDRMAAAADAAMRHYAAHYPTARRWDGAAQLNRTELGEAVWLLDTHSASRPVNGFADPALHMHCRLLNLSLRADDTWSSRFYREMHRAARAVNAVFEAELRRRVEEMGWSTVDQVHGDKHAWTSWEVAEVPEAVRVAFSKRQQSVDERIKDEEVTKGRLLTQKEKAAISRISRNAKAPKTRGEQTARWAETLAEHGYVASLPPAPVRSRAADTRTLVNDAAAQLLADKSVWTHAETLALVADHAVALCLDAATVERLAAEIEGQAVRLLNPNGGEVFTTQARIDRERDVADYFLAMSSDARLAVPRRRADAAIEEYEATTRRALSDEQRAAVYALTSAEGVALLQGWAGAGKSSTLRPVCDALTKSGYQVLGTSTSSRATQQLATDAGVAAWNTRDLITRAENGALRTPEGTPVELGPETVLVVDEAVMSSVQDLSDLVELAKRHHVAGLRLVGDTEQLAPVGSGSIVAWVSSKVALAQVTKNFRQAIESEAIAAQMLREGRGEEYLRAKDKRGLLDIAPDIDTAINAAVEDWAGALRRPDDARRNLLLCDLREAGVTPLNDAARDVYVARGWVDRSQEITVGERRYAVGDRIELQAIHKEQVAKRDADGNVLYRRNGQPRIRTVSTPTRTRGTVTAIAGDKLTIRTDDVGALDSREIHISSAQADRELDYGYAGTVHVSQGMTVDRAFVVAAPTRLLGKQSSYVSASRARIETKVFVVGQEEERRDDTISRVGGLLSRDVSMRTTLDYATAEDRAALAAKIREQQRASRDAWSVNRPATLAQLSLLRGNGVLDASSEWTWLRASCEIDLALGSGIPGWTAESWLTTHGVTELVARERVETELRATGFDRAAALYSATDAQVAIAQRRVAQVSHGKDLTREEKNKLQARVLFQLQRQALPSNSDDHDRTLSRDETHQRGSDSLSLSA